MNRKMLEYFITLAETLNFTTASHKHFVAQTTITRQIALLEEVVGFKLFERNTIGVKLTLAGESFLIDVKQMLQEFDKAIEKAAAISRTQVLRIGHSTDVGRMCLKNVLKIFQKENPDVQISFFQAKPYELIQKLTSDIVDIIAIYRPMLADVPGIDTMEVYKSGIMVGVAKNHRFSERSMVRSIELKDEKVLIPSSNALKKQHDYIVDCCRKDGYVPKLVEVDSYDTQVLMIQLKRGIGFFSDYDVTRTKGLDIRFLKLMDTHHIYYTDFAWKQDNRNDSLKKFIETTNVYNKE